MQLSKRFQINTPETSDTPLVTGEIVDGEVIIINYVTGAYYSLLKVGVDIWRFIEKRATLGEIIEEIRHRYDGQPQEIEESVTELVAQLQREDLITAVELDAVEPIGAIGLSKEDGPATAKLPFEVPLLEKYDDMQELLLLDPIHEVDEAGWPAKSTD